MAAIDGLALGGGLEVAMVCISKSFGLLGILLNFMRQPYFSGLSGLSRTDIYTFCTIRPS